MGMIWTSKHLEKRVFVFISYQNELLVNYYASGIQVYRLDFSQIKSYLTDDEFLDLQRKVFDELV